MTPLFEQTLSDVLVQARLRVDAAEQRVAELERAAELARAREARLAREVEEQMRAALADPELPDRPAPPIPSMAEISVSARGSDAFFDALIGPARP